MDGILGTHLRWKFLGLLAKKSSQVVSDQDLSVYPIGMWEFNGDLDDPETCISIKSKSGALNVSANTNVGELDNSKPRRKHHAIR